MEGSYPFPFLHFPCPFFDDIDIDALLQHQNLAMNKNKNNNNNNSPLPSTEVGVATSEANIIMSNGDGDGDIALVKKTGKNKNKNDRHSKIRTAQGLRDRRMRLSVKVARRFFDLQDMLDFDKASKTIEWLLENSDPAIQELLARSNKCLSSSASVSEEVSVTNKEMEIMQITREESLVGTKPLEKRPRRRRCYKAAPASPFARESRDKARERARARTRERMMLKTHKHHLEAARDSAAASNQNIEFLGFTGSEVGCHAMTMISTNPNYSEEHSSKPQTSSIFMTTSNGEQWNPSSMFGTTPNTQDQQNPISNSIFMNISALELGIPSPVFTPTNSSIGLNSHFLGNQFL